MNSVPLNFTPVICIILYGSLVIIISKLLKHHSKAKRRAPAYSHALPPFTGSHRQYKWGHNNTWTYAKRRNNSLTPSQELIMMSSIRDAAERFAASWLRLQLPIYLCVLIYNIYIFRYELSCMSRFHNAWKIINLTSNLRPYSDRPPW